jgi:tRNA-(ms[2]io[6]A)-hydroxylase
MVHEIIKKRGFKLGRERKDSYVNELYKFMNKGGSRLNSMVDRLLFSAMIEARSCERFKLLSEEINDPELSKFYHDLMISEAGHYTTFICFARKYGKDIDVDSRWKELVEFEGELIKIYGKLLFISSCASLKLAIKVKFLLNLINL